MEIGVAGGFRVLVCVFRVLLFSNEPVGVVVNGASSSGCSSNAIRGHYTIL